MGYSPRRLSRGNAEWRTVRQSGAARFEIFKHPMANYLDLSQTPIINLFAVVNIGSMNPLALNFQRARNWMLAYLPANYVDEQAPWALRKTDRSGCRSLAFFAVRKATVVIPESADSCLIMGIAPNA
jgi:hypothetical protein